MDNEYIGEVLECIDDLLTEANAFNKLVDKGSDAVPNHLAIKFIDKQNKDVKGVPYPDRPEKPTNRDIKQEWMKTHGNERNLDKKLPNDQLKPNRYLKKQLEKEDDKVILHAGKTRKIDDMARNLRSNSNKSHNPISKLIYKKGAKKLDKLTEDEFHKSAKAAIRAVKLDKEMRKLRKESVEDCYNLDDLKLRTYESFRNGFIEESTVNDILELLDVIETGELE